MKRQKSKKPYIKGILFMVGSIIVGYLLGYNSIKIFPKEFIRTLNVGVILIICAATYYGSILLHELGHFWGFKVNGVSIRMIKVSIIGIIFNKDKSRLKINPSGLGISGIVVPHIGVISDEAEFKRMQEAYGKAIIVAPLVSLSLMILGSIIVVISNVIGIMSTSYLVIIGAFLCLLNGLLCIGCFIKTENVYGDFRAYSYFKKDNFFAALMMYQYVMFAEEFAKERVANTYLRQVLLEEVQDRMVQRKMDLLTVSCAATFLMEYLVGEMESLPGYMTDYIDYCYFNQPLLITQKVLEVHKGFLIYIAYYYEKIGEHSKAREIYEDFITKLPKNQVFHYWKMQAQQIILKEDYSRYLLDVKHIKPNSLYKIFGVFDGFYEDELILNQIKRDELVV